MTNFVFKHTPLYRFLEYCNQETKEEKTILDCGAGGNMPPLYLFKMHGFTTAGIDFSHNQVEKANAFATENAQVLNIEYGDMTRLPYSANSFHFVYSYNSIFHMKKKQTQVALEEMKRVLKPGGLMFVNFLSVDDERCGEGPHLGLNQYEQMDDEPVIHSYYDYNEGDSYFNDMEFVLKERRIIERIFEGEKIKQGFIDYIVRKKI